MSEPESLTGSSTAVEIRVQLPIPPDKSAEGALTLTKRRVKFRSTPTISQLESGSVIRECHPSARSKYSPYFSLRNPDPRDVSPGIFHKIGSSELYPKILASLNFMLDLGSRLVLAFLSVVCTNVLLFRRPLAYASEIDPILKQARNCRDEARLHLCTGKQPEPYPNSVAEFKESWERYLEDKIKEWSRSTCLAGFLSTFVLVALQVADKSDPATRVLAYMTFAAMFFCLMVNQYLFPRYLDHRRANDVHHAYHLLEHADEEISSTWNIHMLLSMSSVSTWWVVLLSGTAFTSLYYHDTQATGSTAEIVLLSFSQMVVARVAMAALILALGLCWLLMDATLKRLDEKAVQHKHTVNA
ncbi:hypothetical protein FB451DRAFT_495687 [Mycena latifolia]|nr:hypothetical protein FB451DRAFT_495687 [Mycena latifolia]